MHIYSRDSRKFDSPKKGMIEEAQEPEWLEQPFCKKGRIEMKSGRAGSRMSYYLEPFGPFERSMAFP